MSTPSIDLASQMCRRRFGPGSYLRAGGAVRVAGITIGRRVIEAGGESWDEALDLLEATIRRHVPSALSGLGLS